ncbi:hypothetical protein BK004_04970 [bacterium CG10_46_32]|nr:MAG: hypothetical protein BK004_04970 [bacterium CG10_46_32]PIR55666.1 MAG: hypothetical protein COU73_05020 [Parcubacteria group bacterium CG10_big_fil_rev_8_21_14_0_10_46_32]
MTTSLIQLTLALAPIFLVGAFMQRVTMPWEKEKRPAERADLLRMLAKDISRVKTIMALNINAVNEGRACVTRPLPLSNWNRLKKDARFHKYSNEPIFKQMIRQFQEWERAY